MKAEEANSPEELNKSRMIPSSGGRRRSNVRRSTMHIDHKYWKVIWSFFVIISSAIIGSAYLSAVYSLTFVYNVFGISISIAVFDSTARFSAYAATYYLAYPEAFSSTFYFRLFWCALFIAYGITDFLYYLAIPSTVNGEIIPNILPPYWMSFNFLVDFSYFSLFLIVFAHNRRGNPKSTPPTGLIYYLILFLHYFLPFIIIFCYRTEVFCVSYELEFCFTFSPIFFKDLEYFHSIYRSYTNGLVVASTTFFYSIYHYL